MEYSGNFMCSDCMKDEFNPRYEKYNIDYVFLKNNWKLIIDLEKNLELLIINNHDYSKNISDNMFEFVLEKINTMVLTSPFYAMNKKY